MSADPALGVPLVFLVDDEKDVRDGLTWLLRSRRLLSQGFASAESFVAALDEPEPATPDRWPAGPSCLLLDLRMGGMSGVALFDQLLARGLLDAMPVIFLTGHGDMPTAVSVLKRGAFDFVEKPFSDNTLIERVQRALRLSAERLASRAQARERRAPFATLSEREAEVLRRVAAGHTNKAIAGALGLSSRTVEIHRANVFDKLRVASAVDLVNLLREIEQDGWGDALRALR